MSAVVCRDCGYTEQCPHCEVSLKYHRGFGSKSDALVCHYCSYAKIPQIKCPECSSVHIRHVGIGTQRVEEEVLKLFPDARVIRADKDTTDNKEGFSPIYKSFKEGRYDVLVGTQMIAKGLDFSKVSLIGIILADIGLHIPDFNRAGTRSCGMLYRLRATAVVAVQPTVTAVTGSISRE